MQSSESPRVFARHEWDAAKLRQYKGQPKPTALDFKDPVTGRTDDKAYGKAYQRWFYWNTREERLAENRSRYVRTVEERRTRGSAQYAALKKKVVALLGAECAACGIDDLRVLQVDHVNGCELPNTAKGRGGQALYRNIAAGRRSTTDLQLLCANCNAVKRVEQHEYGDYKKRRGILSAGSTNGRD